MPRKAKQKSSPKRPTVLLLSEDERIFLHLALKDGLEVAANTRGLKPDEVKALLKVRAVQQYISQYQHAFLKQMAAYELGRITRQNVTREDVIGRYWALANVPADETRGSIEGQKLALDEIAAIFGMKFSPRDADKFFEGKTPAQLENYAKFGKFDPSEEEKAEALSGAPKPDDSK